MWLGVKDSYRNSTRAMRAKVAGSGGGLYLYVGGDLRRANISSAFIHPTATATLSAGLVSLTGRVSTDWQRSLYIEPGCSVEGSHRVLHRKLQWR